MALDLQDRQDVNSASGLFGANRDSLFGSVAARVQGIIADALQTPEAQRAALASMPAQSAFNLMISRLKAETTSPEQTKQIDNFAGEMNKHPELVGALHKAVVNDHSVLPALQGMAQGAGSDLQSITEALKDGNNVELTTAILNKVAYSNTDDINGGFFLEAMAKGKKASNPNATPEDYKAFSDHLKKAGIVDPRVEIAQDPMKMWRMLIEEPETLTKMFSNMIGDMEGLSPELKNMITGALGTFVNMMSAFVNPQGDFVGHYNNEILRPIGDALEATGAAINNDVSAIDTFLVGSTNDVNTPLRATDSFGRAAAGVTHEQEREYERAAPAPTVTPAPNVPFGLQR